MELTVAERYSLLEEDICRPQDALPVQFQKDLKDTALRQHNLLDRPGTCYPLNWTFPSADIKHMKRFWPGCWVGQISSYMDL